jgi:hypothetical protein
MQSTKLLSATAAQKPVLLLGGSGSPFVNAYPWSDSTGYGSKYADPSTAVPTSVNGLAFSPLGNAVVASVGSSPYIVAYSFTSAGFGTKFSNPSTLPGANASTIVFAPDASAIICIDSTYPHVSAYAWSSAGFGTKYSNPSAIPGGPLALAFHPNGNFVFFGSGSSDCVVYGWSSSTGFGTKYLPPLSISGTARDAKFSVTGEAIIIAVGGGVGVEAFHWSSSGFGSKYSAPASLPTGTSYISNLAINPTGDYIVLSSSALSGNNPSYQAYPWSDATGYGTKIAGSASVLTGGSTNVAFSPKGGAVSFGTNGSPYTTTLAWSAGSFGSAYSNPSTLPTGAVENIAFGETQ